MTKALIPYCPPFGELEKNNLGIQKSIFKKNRHILLNELRCLSGVPEIISQFNQDTVYKIVAAPEGANLYKDAAGNIKGVFYRDGKIVEHAKLKAVHPSLVKAATAIGSQILLVSIAMQLNRIEKGISRIINEFHNDRISEIFSGCNQYHQAITVQDINRQSRLIEHAIQTLNIGIEKTIRSLKVQIADAPNPQIGFLDNWRTNKSKIAEEKMKMAEESFQASLIGIKTLSECYAILNEPVTAVSVLTKNMSDLKASGIEMAVRKARLIEFKASAPPEASWKHFLKYEAQFMHDIQSCNSLANKEFDCIEIEFKPKELLENKHEKM
ncbi:MAG: hypothetical protein JRJ38_10455 [Deltaproteobacteria bacterium]|nr:hypothetical protein [Deltaproteobacteria bacterium]